MPNDQQIETKSLTELPGKMTVASDSLVQNSLFVQVKVSTKSEEAAVPFCGTKLFLLNCKQLIIEVLISISSNI